MEVTADGSPVDVYLLLPPNGEAEIVHAAVPPDASILELGSGAGRVTHPLLELGHQVVAVDDSAAMLAHVRAETVCARIGDLRLGRTFDAVLLSSHLVNTEHAADRGAMLAAARRHLAPAGGSSSSGIRPSGSPRPRPAKAAGSARSKSSWPTSSATAMCSPRRSVTRRVGGSGTRSSPAAASPSTTC
jgi:SAM-dependent methyltransferase